MPNAPANYPPLSFEDLVWLVDAEYREMPGMRLTHDQIRRLWSLTSADCDKVLEYLVTAGRLTVDREGRFCRPGDSR